MGYCVSARVFMLGTHTRRDFLKDVCPLAYSSTYRDAKHIYLQNWVERAFGVVE